MENIIIVVILLCIVGGIVRYINNNTGTDKYLATEYEVFSGISVVYYSSHTPSGILTDITEEGDVFEIFHCREGRMECSIGEDFCYISPGDLLIVKKERLSPANVIKINSLKGKIFGFSP